MTMASFAITVYGQCCLRHVEGQRVVSDIIVLVVIEVFVDFVARYCSSSTLIGLVHLGSGRTGRI